MTRTSPVRFIRDPDTYAAFDAAIEAFRRRRYRQAAGRL